MYHEKNKETIHKQPDGKIKLWYCRHRNKCIMATSGKPKNWVNAQDELMLYLFKVPPRKNGADPENLHVTYIDKFSTKQLPDQTYKLLVPLYHKKSKNPTWMEFWPSQEVIFSCACLVSAVNDN